MAAIPSSGCSLRRRVSSRIRRSRASGSSTPTGSPGHRHREDEDQPVRLDRVAVRRLGAAQAAERVGEGAVVPLGRVERLVRESRQDDPDAGGGEQRAGEGSPLGPGPALPAPVPRSCSCGRRWCPRAPPRARPPIPTLGPRGTPRHGRWTSLAGTLDQAQRVASARRGAGGGLPRPAALPGRAWSGPSSAHGPAQRPGPRCPRPRCSLFTGALRPRRSGRR